MLHLRLKRAIAHLEIDGGNRRLLRRHHADAIAMVSMAKDLLVRGCDRAKIGREDIVMRTRRIAEDGVKFRLERQGRCLSHAEPLRDGLRVHERGRHGRGDGGFLMGETVELVGHDGIVLE